MKIYYHLSSYFSHRRAGEAYMRCLAPAGHELTSDPSLADLVVLHDEPDRYQTILRQLPRKKQSPVIGYCVWEADILPEAYVAGLALVDAVWTCSDFSLAAIQPHAHRVDLLPHVVERLHPDSAALAWARDRLQPLAGKHLFYTIADGTNPRKNLPGLLSAFGAACAADGVRAALVVKQYRDALPLDSLAHVLAVNEILDDAQIAALHALCDTYVSAHHAEAWGLPLSEAMSMGRAVIATGYSGNMQFMNTANSFPMPYALAPVSAAMCAASAFFTPRMHWADVDAAALVTALRRHCVRPVSPEFRQRVQGSMAEFSPENTAWRLQQLLAPFTPC